METAQSEIRVQRYEKVSKDILFRPTFLYILGETMHPQLTKDFIFPFGLRRFPVWRGCSNVKKMTEMGNRGTNKCLGDWLDNDEVCKILKISKRTLQTLRDNGTLAYSQISHKTYYKQEDVQSVIDIVKDRKKDAVWRKPRKKSESKDKKSV